MKNADFAVVESSNIKSDGADRKRSKKIVKGSGLTPSGLQQSARRKTSKISTSRRGSDRVNEYKQTGKKDSYANQPVSFVSSGIMEETVKIATADSIEMDSGCKNDNSGPADFGAFEVHTKGFGSKMMAKMGFVEGGGLGKGGQGIAQPIEVIKRPKSLGIGVEFSDIVDDRTRSNPVRKRSQTIGAFEKHNERTRSNPVRNRSQTVGAFEKYTKGFGSKMMAKMGFAEGMGLGRDSQGRVNPLVAVRLPKSRGLGAEG